MTPETMAILHGRCFTTPRAWSAGELVALLGSPGVFLSEAAHGFALGRVAADEAELLTLAVDPATRRQGIGRRLLTAFEYEALAGGARMAFLEVNAENLGAIALYESSGYRRAGLRRRYYATPENRRVDAFVFARDLR